MKLYKYREFGEFTDKIIQNSSLYFSSPESFNDPFDCNLQFKNPITKEQIAETIINIHNVSHSKNDNIDRIVATYMDKPEEFANLMQKQLANRIVSDIGVLSLSADPKNILMWSHYASNHEGLVLEFNISQNSPCFINVPDTPPILALPVEYKTRYQLLNYGNAEDIERLLLTKYIDWKYEQEYRVIDIHYQGEKEFKKLDLTGIIFGLKASESDIRNLIHLCKKYGYKHVQYKRAKKIPGNFSLSIENLSNFD